MADRQHMLWASLLLALHCVTKTAAMGVKSHNERNHRHLISRKSGETPAVLVRSTPLFQMPTVASQSRQASSPPPDSQVEFEGISLQISPDTTADDKQSDEFTSPATELSAAEQRMLQRLGWSLGRRGLEALKALADNSPPLGVPEVNSESALQAFWKHLAGLSWLPYQKRKQAQEPDALLAPLAQHAVPGAAQQAQQDNFKLAHQALQQAAQQATRHIDHSQSMQDSLLYSSPESASSLETGEVTTAGQIVLKRADSDELLHFDVPLPIKQHPDNSNTPRAALVLSQDGQGDTRQEAALVTINREGSKQPEVSLPGGVVNIHSSASGQSLGSSIEAASGERPNIHQDQISWPSNLQLPMDDDTLTAWASMPAGETKRHPSRPQSELRQSGQQVSEQLPLPSEHKQAGNQEQPQIALAQAKQDFAQWLTAPHGDFEHASHPDHPTSPHEQESQIRQAMAGVQSSDRDSSMNTRIEAGNSSQLKYASLGV